MTASPVGQSLLVQAQAYLQELERAHATRFGDEALAWLVVVPFWTDTLASQASFPAGEGGLDGLVDGARQAGLLSVVGGPSTPGGRKFWVPDVQRPDLLHGLEERMGLGGLARVASRVAEVLEGLGDEVPPALRRWAELAVVAEKGPGAVARRLMDRLGELAGAGPESALNTAAALDWMEAGEALGQVLGGDLTAAVLIARRRVELAYRRSQDERHLANFLEREGQIREVEHLLALDGDPGVWAVHFLGMGGVGKTMLIRYVTARAAPKHGFLSSRVDFDHLSPEFPVRRPAQLLLELAEELRAYSESQRVDTYFEEFQLRVQAVHEDLSGGPLGADPLANLESESFADILRAFADLLRLLDRPVLFILDTCEELSKLPSVGGRIPAIEATFAILERLHEAVPQLRVVFAGRRLLARSGHGWTQGSEEPGNRAAIPEEKAYLRLHQIRGFDRDEAVRYLSQVPRLTREPELLEAILDRSPDPGTAAVVYHLDETPAGAAEDRYNPFDLALFARWVDEDPSLGVEQVASGRDAYVEIRIVRRLEADPDLQGLIPAAALLGRFEARMLRPAFAGSDEAFARAVRRLGDQEWMDHQRDQALDVEFMEVDRNLRSRLLDYYRGDRAGAETLERIRRQLAGPLEALVREQDPGRLGVAHVDGALRVLPPEAAVELWLDLERRIAREGNWGWARRVTALLLGRHGAVGPEGGPLSALVRATHTAALIHEGGGLELLPQWSGVLEQSAECPDADVAADLAERARLGRIVAAVSRGRDPSTGDSRALLQRLADGVASEGADVDQGVARVVAVVEALLEAGRPVPVEAFADWARGLDEAAVDPCLTAFARTLEARARRAGGERVPVPAPPPGLELEAGRQPWLDWRAPEALRERLRLEHVIAVPYQGPLDGLPEWREWRDEALGRLDSADAERLVSAILVRELSVGLVPGPLLHRIGRADRYDAERSPTVAAHRAVPSLAITLARGLAALGEVNPALARIHARHRVAETTRSDTDSVREADRAIIRLEADFRQKGQADSIVRMRLRSLQAGGSIRGSDPESLRESLRWDALVGPRPWIGGAALRSGLPGALHSWWRSRWIGTPEELVEGAETFLEEHPRALERLDGLDDEARLDEALALILDEEELARLAPGRARPPAALPEGGDVSTPEDVRRLLRRLALEGAELLVPGHARRALAELALEEGELLSLRFPVEACGLLEFASVEFRAVEDWLGGVRADAAAVLALARAGRIEAAAYRAQERLREWMPPEGDLQVEEERWARGLASTGWADRLRLCRLVTEATSRSATLTFIQRRGGRSLRASFEARWGDEIPRELTSVLDVLESGDRASGMGATGQIPVPPGTRGPPEREETTPPPQPGDGAPGAGGNVDEEGPEARPDPPAPALPGSPSLRPGPVVVPDLEPMRPEGSVTLGPAASRSGVTGKDLRTIAVGVAGVAVLAVVGFLAWGVLSSGSPVEGTPVGPVERGPGFGLPLAGVLATVVIGVLAPVWLPLLRRGLRRLADVLTGRRVLHLGVEVVGQGGGEEGELSFTARSQRQSRLSAPWGEGVKRRTLLSGRMPRPHLDEYGAMAEALPAELAGLARAAQTDLVRLELDPELDHLPWEGLLHHAAREAWPIPPRVWRTAQLSGPRGAGRRWHDPRLLVVASHRWRYMAEQGWEELDWPRTVQQALRHDSPAADVVHLMGTATATSGGVRLQVGDDAPGTFKGSVTNLGPRISLVSATDLQLDRAALVVLQGEPVSGSRRLATDRERAARLRTFGGELFWRGAGAVVVLPSLSQTVAEPAVARIARAVREGPPSIPTLLDTLRDVREIVGEEGEEDRMDLALWAR